MLKRALARVIAGGWARRSGEGALTGSRAAHAAGRAEGGGQVGDVNSMKINKLMVQRGLCSRREANDYIKRRQATGNSNSIHGKSWPNASRSVDTSASSWEAI